MSDAFTRAAAALVADPNMGLDAVYLPASGPSIACRVVYSEPVEHAGSLALAKRRMASVPASAVAAPARGDQLRIPSLARPDNLFKVEQVETDPMRAMHDLTLSQAAS
ncbi:hypothetical protein KTR66_04660 [Roseococcus sp. SDR]|uniref:head-tail joining protein n=1 Tax=Roseococcus sp. SDR TaxID=2835532 RepID=UPI001BCCCC75|nr:hypothetical protein [Roseococcus sp. SDR]MBS7789271.1 hypothetical protein [Roseococcus sp. SDR]MBV1844585.1 hypothetical protein [Roseococcus sp. SDR]